MLEFADVTKCQIDSSHHKFGKKFCKCEGKKILKKNYVETSNSSFEEQRNNIT